MAKLLSLLQMFGDMAKSGVTVKFLTVPCSKESHTSQYLNDSSSLTGFVKYEMWGLPDVFKVRCS